MDTDNGYSFVPEFEFELVDVEDPGVAEESPVREFFPLFSGSDQVAVSLEDRQVDVDDRLVENVARPESYYFARYTAAEQQAFQQAAVDGRDVLQQSQKLVPSNYKVISISAVDEPVRVPLPPQQKARRGRKQRLAKIEAKKRKKQWTARVAQLAKLTRVKKTRRGGRKSKAKSS
ncbi:hypothetical protein OGAPHI_002938 [Ogataea philodendri]|uniref:Uncharacterized protein n=1 Tax=Ogataea philodendri TaxID=1378263 RepID=A0A9P8P9R3_9ASCO|nr:uncharacterized protein OGAPHI_002938 [Ogataea philodendri]KAH3667289.1 hypothetical protein OGAPHI_002938 [Ogataea philodendri]